jgi:hypothetical protein
VKRSHGTEYIRQLADAVIDNNGPRLALYRALDTIAASRRWPQTTPQQATIAGLGLPSRLAAYMDASWPGWVTRPRRWYRCWQ